MSNIDIPSGHHTVNPYLMLKGVDEFVQYMQNLFAAEILFRTDAPDGKIMHAEIKVGDSVIMMGEASGEFPVMPGSFYIYVDDVDGLYHKGLEMGSESIMEPVDQFYGHRSGSIKDSWGNIWWLSKQLMEVSEEEVQKFVDGKNSNQ